LSNLPKFKNYILVHANALLPFSKEEEEEEEKNQKTWLFTMKITKTRV
jgi:hypothetical protein